MSDLFPAWPQKRIATAPAQGDQAADTGDRLSALFRSTGLEQNANFTRQRRRAEIKRDLANQVLPRIPRDQLGEGPNAAFTEGEILDIARSMAEESPEAWADVDLSDEAIEERLNESLKAEDAELQGILAMSPDGNAVVDFLASMAGATADIKNAPFLVFGGFGGSIGRVMLREAALNFGAEVVNVPDRLDMAERLEKPEPNLLAELAGAAVFGGVLGGGLELGFRGIRALGRGVKAYKDRNLVPGPIESQAAVDAAEDALVQGDTDFFRKAIEDARRDAPEEPEVRDAVPFDDAEYALARTVEAEVDQRMAEIERDFPEMRRKYPLAQSLPKVKSTMMRNGERVRTPAAQELANAGIRPRTHPFLFDNKNGLSDFDNLVASEYGDLQFVLPVDQSSGYFEPDALLSAMVDELSGRGKTPVSPEVAARMAELEGLASMRNIDGFMQDGNFVASKAAIDASPDPDAFVRSGINRFERENSLKLDDEIRTAAARILQESGGDADSAVERALIQAVENDISPRLADEPEFDDIPFFDGEVGRPDPASRPAPEREPDRPAARDRAEGEGDGPSPASRTVEAPPSVERFSDPASKEAVDANLAALDDMRSQIERDGDFEIDMVMEDGTHVRTASALLRYAEDGVEFAEIIQLCGRRA